MGSQIAFLLFATVVVFAAWRVVNTPDVMRAALALVLVLGGMAPLFILLAAEFVAAVQILVYVGAVIILFLFGVMLTRSPVSSPGAVPATNRGRRWSGGVISLLLFVALLIAVRDAFGSEQLDVNTVVDTRAVGFTLLHDHVLPFEAVSVLLLAALVGSIVLARREP